VGDRESVEVSPELAHDDVRQRDRAVRCGGLGGPKNGADAQRPFVEVDVVEAELHERSGQR
jgi:hypothetical protein